MLIELIATNHGSIKKAAPKDTVNAIIVKQMYFRKKLRNWTRKSPLCSLKSEIHLREEASWKYAIFSFVIILHIIILMLGNVGSIVKWLM